MTRAFLNLNLFIKQYNIFYIYTIPYATLCLPDIHNVNFSLYGLLELSKIDWWFSSPPPPSQGLTHWVICCALVSEVLSHSLRHRLCLSEWDLTSLTEA